MCHINDKCYEVEQKQLLDKRDGVILYRMSGLASLIWWDMNRNHKGLSSVNVWEEYSRQRENQVQSFEVGMPLAGSRKNS